MGTLFWIVLTISGTLNQLTSQLKIDPILAKYLGENLPANLYEIDRDLNDTGIFYDSSYTAELFGEVPREFLIQDLPSGGTHIQLVYEFSKKSEANGYGPSMNIIKQLSFIFGKPANVAWLDDRIILKWARTDLELSVIHRELKPEGLVILRVDMMNNILFSANQGITGPAK